MDGNFKSNLDGKLNSEESMNRFYKNDDNIGFPLVPVPNEETNEHLQQTSIANEDSNYQDTSRRSMYEKQYKKSQTSRSSNAKVIKGVAFPDPIVEENYEDPDMIVINNKKNIARSNSIPEEPVLNYLNQSNEMIDSDFSQLPSDNSSTPRNFSEQNTLRVNDMMKKFRMNEKIDDRSSPTRDIYQDNSVSNLFRYDTLKGLRNSTGNLEKPANENSSRMLSSSIFKKRPAYNTYDLKPTNFRTSSISNFSQLQSRRNLRDFRSTSNLANPRSTYSSSTHLNLSSFSTQPRKYEQRKRSNYFIGNARTNLGRAESSTEIDQIKQRFDNIWIKDRKNINYDEQSMNKTLHEAIQPAVLEKYRTQSSSYADPDRVPPSLNDFIQPQGFKGNSTLMGKMANAMLTDNKLNSPSSSSQDKNSKDSISGHESEVNLSADSQ